MINHLNGFLGYDITLSESGVGLNKTQSLARIVAKSWPNCTSKKIDQIFRVSLFCIAGLFYLVASFQILRNHCNGKNWYNFNFFKITLKIHHKFLTAIFKVLTINVVFKILTVEFCIIILSSEIYKIFKKNILDKFFNKVELFRFEIKMMSLTNTLNEVAQQTLSSHKKNMIKQSYAGA